MTIKRTATLPDGSECTIILSDDSRHRHMLTRSFAGHVKGSGYLLFILAEPDRAREMEDQVTKKCASFAGAWGYSAFRIAYLSSPDSLIAIAAQGANVIACAWGAKGGERADSVLHLLAKEAVKLRAFKLTKDGHPAIPTYQPANAELIAFEPD